ncbi:MAG TPA: hypothetical protein VN703_03610 [Candidatus Sulfopaludibacter sp.]|jgi:hypothetical protein|nr:hypothetical protein [Candidatus Sulfopaludibacter sp.]
MGFEIIYTPEDNTFKSFKLYVEVESKENNECFKVKLVNPSLGLESISIGLNDNNETINTKIEKDLKLTWNKIVEEYDDSKLIFRKLEKIKNNLKDLKKQ